MKYCLNCKRRVKPRKDFSIIKFLLWTFLTGIGGIIYIIYYWGKPKSCPVCGERNWGKMPATRPAAARR